MLASPLSDPESLQACAGCHLGDRDFVDEVAMALAQVVPHRYSFLRSSDAANALRAAHRDMAEKALQAFDLPPSLVEATRILSRHWIQSTECFRRLAAPGPMAQALRGFTRAVPLVAELAFGSPAFLRALDAGTPPGKAVATFLPAFAPTHLRRLAGISRRDIGARERDDLQRFGLPLLEVLTNIPPDWIPSRDEMVTFRTVAGMALDLKAQDLDPVHLLSASKGDWAGILQRVREVDHAQAPDGRVCFEPRMAADAALALQHELVAPLVAHGCLRRGLLDERRFDEEAAIDDIKLVAGCAAPRILFGDKTLAGVAEATHEWHRRQEAISDAVAQVSPEDAWPALFAPVRFEDVEVRVVSDGASLAEEGSHGKDRNGVPGMGHCVATRRPRLMRGEAHVVSVRRLLPDGGYQRLSTAQLECGGDGMPRVEEHRGLRNGEPPLEAVGALGLLAAGIREGRIPLAPEALEPRSLPVHDDEIARNCRYDWRSEERLAAALEAWSPLLPRWLRGATPEAAFGMLLERGLLGTLEEVCAHHAEDDGLGL